MPIKHLLIVMTAPRPNGANYADDLRSDLVQSRERIRIAVLIDSDGMGQARSLWAALRLGSKSERLTVLEDDIVLSRNAIEYIDRYPVPDDVAFVTWYDGHQVPEGAPWGLVRRPAQAFICHQAVTYPRRTVARLIASNEIDTWERHRGDVLVARILTGETYGVHVPTLVQHIGADSICNPGQGLEAGRGRRGRNFLGRGFDALSILPGA